MLWFISSNKYAGYITDNRTACSRLSKKLREREAKKAMKILKGAQGRCRAQVATRRLFASAERFRFCCSHLHTEGEGQDDHPSRRDHGVERGCSVQEEEAVILMRDAYVLKLKARGVCTP